MIERTENLLFYRDKAKVGQEIYHKSWGRGKIKHIDRKRSELLIDYDGRSDYLFHWPNDVYIVDNKRYGRLACDHDKEKWNTVYIYKNWFNKVPDSFSQQEDEEFLLYIDYFQTGVAYWKQIFHLIRKEKLVNEKELIDQIKKNRYAIRMPKPRRYSNFIINWAWKIIEEEVGDPTVECIDNFRIARLDKRKDLKRYNKVKSQGCCGSFDTIRRAPNLYRYKIGCNYGH